MHEKIIAIATVTSPGLHVRRGPGDDYGSIDELTAGDQLEIYERKGNRLRGRVSKVRNDVEAEDRTKQIGWVHGNFVSLSQVVKDSGPGELPPVDIGPPDKPDYAGWQAGGVVAAFAAVIGAIMYSCSGSVPV